MKAIKDDFSRFEYEGWERVADKYDSVWSSLTRQFIPYLVNAVEVSPGMSVLDVACGPGYISEAIRKLGAISTGIDFSEKMVAIAKKMFPGIRFAQGDAQNLSCDDGSFDRVLVNFGLLHLSCPEQACAEAFRVFEIEWQIRFHCLGPASAEPGAKIVDDAIEARADLNVQLPEGPPRYLYDQKEECQAVPGEGRVQWRLNDL